MNTYERLLEVNAKIRKESKAKKLSESQERLIALKKKADELVFMRELKEIEGEFVLLVS